MFICRVAMAGTTPLPNTRVSATGLETTGARTTPTVVLYDPTFESFPRPCACVVNKTTLLPVVRVIPPHHNRFTAVFLGPPGELVPEQNFWTLWCKGRLTEADTPTIRLGGTTSGLTNAHLHHPPFFTGRMPYLPPNQQHQSTEGT